MNRIILANAFGLKLPQINGVNPRPIRQVVRLAAKFFCSKVSSFACSILGRFSFYFWGVKAGNGLIVRGFLRIHNGGKFLIGDNVRINSGSSNFVGGDRRMSFWIGSKGVLEIGNRCAISNSTIACRNRIKIGDFTFIGGGCSIYDNDFHQVNPTDRINNRGSIGTGPVDIGSHVFIGAGVTILKNVSIGKGAVVGAGSVVTKSVGAYELWAGAPARFIRNIAVADHESIDGLE
ncbi:acyltransferase [Crateriforma conspicua]|nr:acyltransferase [Crateriforma conspicua]